MTPNDPWPRHVPTHGPRAMGSFRTCESCERVGTWAVYGATPLCMACAQYLATGGVFFTNSPRVVPLHTGNGRAR